MEKKISEKFFEDSLKNIDFKTENEKMIKKINKNLEKKFEDNFLDFIEKSENFCEIEEKNKDKEIFDCLKNIEELTFSNYKKNKIWIDFEKINLLLNNNKENGLLDKNFKKKKIEKNIFETFKKIDSQENVKKNFSKIITKQFNFQNINNTPKNFKIEIYQNSPKNEIKKINFENSPKNELKKVNFENSPKSEIKKISDNMPKKFSSKKYSLRSSEPFDEKLLIKSDILEMEENFDFEEHQKNLLSESINKKILFDTDEKYFENEEYLEEEILEEKDFGNFDNLLNKYKQMEFPEKKNLEKKNLNELLKKAKKKTKNLKILEKEEVDIDFDTFKKQFSFKDTKDIISEINKIYEKTQKESIIEEEEIYRTAGSLVRETYDKNPNLLKNDSYIDESFEMIEKEIFNKKNNFEKEKKDNLKKENYFQKSADFKNFEKYDKKKLKKLIKKENLDLFNKNKNFEDYKKEVIDKNIYFSEKTNKNSKKSFSSYEYLSLNPDLISLNFDEEEIFRNKLNILVTKMMNKKAKLNQTFWKMKKKKIIKKKISKMFLKFF